MEKQKSINTDVVINSSVEKVWDALYTRFGDIHLYNPNLTGSHFTKGNLGEVGCERQCHLDSKTYINERITSAVPLKHFTVDVIGGNMPMVKSLNVQFDLTALGVNQTKVLIHAHFTSKPAFMAIIMKFPFKKRLTNLLIGLKYYLETGKYVFPDNFNPVQKKFQHLHVNESFA